MAETIPTPKFTPEPKSAAPTAPKPGATTKKPRPLISDPANATDSKPIPATAPPKPNPVRHKPIATASAHAEKQNKFRQDSEASKFSDKLLRDPELTTPGQLDPMLQSKGKSNAKKKKLLTKEEKAAAKERLMIDKSKLRADKSGVKLDAARDKLAKQKPYKPPTIAERMAQTVKYEAVAQAHREIHEVEGENVGVEAAHKIEIQAERAGRVAVRHVKHRIRTRPARRVRKLEKRNIKANTKLRFQKLAQENPELKKNAFKRLWHKKRIRKALSKKATVTTVKATFDATDKTAAVVGKVLKPVIILAKSPKALLILGICLLLIFIIQSCSAMSMTLFNSLGGAVIGGTSYLAESEEITEVTLRYSQWEVDLLLEAKNAETSHPGYDEYRFYLDSIGHCPFALVAYLTVKHNDFTFAAVESDMWEIFNEQYTLTFTPSVEIRTRIETRTGTDENGNSYTYTVIVEYEWHILTVTLTARNFMEIIRSRLTTQDDIERFELLMITKGNRQYIDNPFDFYWRPFISSHFGYRIHPISGERSFHTGIDIAVPQGTPILAGGSGVVTLSGWHGGYGYTVIIYYGDGISALYAHCSVLLVTVGQTVETGDIIALVGSTGNSTGPHLHLEVIKNGRFLNPLFFVVGTVNFQN